MRKQLLLSMALLCGMAANAANVGDCIYTATSKLQVTGENIVTNGDFANLTENWYAFGTDGSVGQSVDMTKWTIEQGVKDGKNVITSVNAADMNIYQTVQLAKGKTYVISFDIKADNATSSTTALGGTNAISIFMNLDGSISSTSEKYRLVSDNYSIKTDWTTINDTVQVVAGDSSATMLNVVFQNMTEGTQITNFEVHEMTSVYDDRILQREIAWVNELYSSEEWANANGGVVNKPTDGTNLDEVLGVAQGALESSLAGNPLSEADGAEIVNGLEDALSSFLNANCADVTGLFNHWNISKKQQKTLDLGDWVFTGGRWFHCNNVYEPEDIAKVYVDIAGTYDLPSSNATLSLSNWEPGRYAFVLETVGYYYSGTSSALREAPNYDAPFYGMKLFAQGDTTVVDTLPTRYYKHLVKFFDVKEDGNLSIGASWDIPEDYVGKKVGGRWELTNAKVFMLGTNLYEQNRIAAIKNIISGEEALRVMIDSAVVVSNYDAAQYPWGKAILKDSINLGEEDYNLALSIVDKDGNVLNDEALKDTTTHNYVTNPLAVTNLNTATNYMRSAITKFYSTNKPYQTLVEDITFAEGVSVCDTINGTASRKEELLAAIANSKTLLAAVSDVDQGNEYTTMDSLLNLAVTEYRKSAATYEVPSPIILVNANMASLSGWTMTHQDTDQNKDVYKLGKDNASFEDGGTYGYVWRGYTASPRGKLVQDVILTNPGVYEYRAKAYAFNANKAIDTYMATLTTDEITGVTDTTYNQSKVRLIFGLSGAEDSIPVHSRNGMLDGSRAKDDQNLNCYTASTYSLYYIKTDSEPVTFTVGMDTWSQVDGQGANAFGFGDNKLTYYGNNTGDYYTKHHKALQDVITSAEATIKQDTTEYSWMTQEGRVFLVNRAVKAINEAKTLGVPTDAASAKATANAIWTINAAMADVNALQEVALGIDGVFEDVETSTTVKNIVRGVYNMAGMKVADNADNLPAGLYIINGKKVLVK